MQGYRVQVFAGASRSGAMRAYSMATNLFPDHKAWFTHRAPNYRVRVGDFMSIEDAEMFRREARGEFPGAFIVPEEVTVPKNLKN
jgi:hypothetical protein